LPPSPPPPFEDDYKMGTIWWNDGIKKGLYTLFTPFIFYFLFDYTTVTQSQHYI
jgi:hypothetical protein